MHLLRADRTRLERDDALLGTVLECFVEMELAKQLAATSPRTTLMHMRTARGVEVDFVLEGTDGEIAGLEVKAAATVRADDFKHLVRLRDSLGDRFVRGVVLYAGGEPLHFGDRLEAWPLACLWTVA
jgi:predicted AAA+ superfamily ATPase